MVLDFFLDVVDQTSVRGFAFKFDFILVFETTSLVFIFVSVVSSTFNKLPFVLTVGATRKNSKLNRSYSKLSKTVPLSVIPPTALEK